jgi:hypothetical protein
VHGSKHPNAGLLIRRGLYDNLHSFTELEQRISALGDENSKAVGDAFEVFVEGYLATHQKLQAETVWLVGQVPQGIREQMNLPNDAKGIDGIFRTRTGVLVPYQVKFRSQRAYLTYTEIAPFLPGGLVSADGKVSAWFQVHQQATKTLSTLALRLRLGPQSRALKQSKKEVALTSVYDQLRMQKDWP